MSDTVPALDAESIAAARSRQLTLTKPPGSLGRLEDLAAWLCGVQGVCPPRPLDRVRVVIFAGDHGIARTAGTSAFPPEVTAQMVLNFLGGGAAVCVVADLYSVGVRVVDMAVDADYRSLDAEMPETVTALRVRRGSRSLDREDALTVEECERAVAAGRLVADQEIDSGADLLIPGDMGIGNTTPAAALVAALTGAEPADVVGRGTGIDDETWMRKTTAVRDGLFRTRDRHHDPLDVLAALGGADIAAMVGFLSQAARRRTPVLLDGVVSSAAALIAERLAPGSRVWWQAGHRSTEPSQQRALTELELEPLLDLRMRLGEGSGAVTALPLVHAAIATLRNMATFESASVTRSDGESHSPSPDPDGAPR